MNREPFSSVYFVQSRLAFVLSRVHFWSLNTPLFPSIHPSLSTHASLLSSAPSWQLLFALCFFRLRPLLYTCLVLLSSLYLALWKPRSTG